MKKYLTLLLLIFSVSEANAQDGFYIGVDGIWSHTRHRFKGHNDDYSLILKLIYYAKDLLLVTF